jgi:sulfopyruvate decarboxylase subunit alpha
MTLVGELERHHVTHVVGVPDNTSAALFRALSKNSTIEVLTVTREGEAFAVASGLWLGGAVPVVLVQNTGLLESGDSLRGTAMRMGVPLVCLVTYRGYAKLPAIASPDASRAGSRFEMTRADVDSVAVVTEATLDAWRVPCELLRSDKDLARAFALAQELSQPVALLITESLC